MKRYIHVSFSGVWRVIDVVKMREVENALSRRSARRLARLLNRLEGL